MRHEQTIYRGSGNPTQGGAGRVVVQEPGKLASALNPRFDLRNHSPSGFAWGYAGSGPSQLALAILADATDDQHALEHYQEFKTAIIARFAGEFEINALAVREMTGWKAPA